MSVLSDSRPRKYIIGYSLHAMELYAVRVWLPALLAAALVYRGEDVERAAVTAATVGGIALGVGSVGPVMGGAISDRFRAGGERGRDIHTERGVQPRYWVGDSRALGADSRAGVRTWMGYLGGLFHIFDGVDGDRSAREAGFDDGGAGVSWGSWEGRWGRCSSAAYWTCSRGGWHGALGFTGIALLSVVAVWFLASRAMIEGGFRGRVFRLSTNYVRGGPSTGSG